MPENLEFLGDYSNMQELGHDQLIFNSVLSMMPFDITSLSIQEISKVLPYYNVIIQSHFMIMMIIMLVLNAFLPR